MVIEMQIGRTNIFTDVKEINKENIVEVLRDAMQLHKVNAERMDFLLSYEAGNQPLQREKTYRADIDCLVCDNVANQVTEFKCGYVWGNPITLVQRGSVDSGADKESEKIALLNECFEADNVKAKTQEIGYFTEITGICNEYIDMNPDYVEGDSFFTTTILDPRTSFVVKSSYYIDRRDMMGVTFRQAEGITYYTCITRDYVFSLVEDKIESVEINPYGIINIVEWKRSVDRMGCFERQIPEMDNLNLLISDFTNDVDQNTQAVWHGNDVEFDEDENGNIVTPESGEWVLTKTNPNGNKPFINPLTIQYDYGGMLNNIVARRSTILEKCNVPQRNDNSGGSTGLAMSDATGWSAAEMSACKEQPLQEESKMKEVKVVLEIIKTSPFVPADSPLLDLKYSDLQPNIKRNKTYELTTKANAYATFVKHGVNQLDTLKLINAFDDPNQVHADSKEEWQLFIDSNFSSKQDNDRMMQDISDQEQNSPLLK